MAYWLFKQEPGCYSFADLERDGVTTWDGVRNAMAQIHLRTTKPGDKALFYHTGDEKAIVGIMTIAGPPKPFDGKLVAVDVTPVKRLTNAVTLAAIKADDTFADWALVTNSRLSVMPVTPAVWKRIMELSK